jgi:hypothetical protein
MQYCASVHVDILHAEAIDDSLRAGKGFFDRPNWLVPQGQVPAPLRFPRFVQATLSCASLHDKLLCPVAVDDSLGALHAGQGFFYRPNWLVPKRQVAAPVRFPRHVLATLCAAG